MTNEFNLLRPSARIEPIKAGLLDVDELTASCEHAYTVWLNLVSRSFLVFLQFLLLY